MRSSYIPAMGVRDQREQLLQVADGLPIREAMARLTAWYDALIVSLIASAYPHPSAVACPVMVALGGYGRCELVPGSDLDLLVLVEDPAIDPQRIRELLYPLWDLGLEVTYTVRTLEETQHVLAAGDLRSQTALLDARRVWGPETPWIAWQRAAAAILGRRAWRRAFVAGKLREQQERHARHGGSPFFLEPNVKEGMGGLRDGQTMHWIGRVMGAIDPADATAVPRGLSAEEWQQGAAAMGALHRIRWQLHRRAGRRQDRLGFAEQEGLAPTPDQGMQHYYAHAATLRDLNEWTVWRWTRPWWRAAGRCLALRLTRRPWTALGSTLLLAPQRLTDATTVIRAIVTAARRGWSLDPESLRHLRQVQHRLSGVAPCSTELAAVFAEPQALVSALQTLHRSHWLARCFPEFAPLHHRSARDAYHCYTIDAHLLQAVAQMVRLLGDAPRDLPVPQPAIVHARAAISDVAALLLATWYHDVGKGEGHGHAERGAQLARTAAQRLGWEAARVEQVAFLVRSHQLFPRVAFTRDVRDRALIEHFAEAVATTERLAGLYLLSIADLQAVGPTIYTEWKGALLAELYTRAAAIFTGAEGPGLVRAELQRQREQAIGPLLAPELRPLAARWVAGMPEAYLRQMAAEDIAEHVRHWYRCEECPIAVRVAPARNGLQVVDLLAEDRPGLFAKLCGILTAHGLNIVEAQVFSGEHRYVLDRFRCAAPETALDAHWWARVQADLHEVLSGHCQVREVIERHRGGCLQRRAPTASAGTVVIDNAISEDRTVVDIQAADRPGLLYAVSECLFGAGCNIIGAKVATHGHRVHDAFYVQDIDGRKLQDPTQLAALQAQLQQLVEGGCAGS